MGSSLNIPDYSEPAAVGTTVSFNCSNLAEVLIGPNSSTCVGNGRWEPDPREAVCIGTGTATMHTITQRSSEALSQERKNVVASSVTVFVVTSILFFIIGFLSRHFCRKKKRTAADNNVAKKQIPCYEDVVLKQPDQELELKENVAYGPVYIRQSV